MSYFTRQIVYKKDKQFLINIQDKYLPFENGSTASVCWNYEENPSHASKGSILLYKEDGDDKEYEIGALNVLTREFFFKTKRINVGLLGDFVVDVSHRTLSPALKLAKHATNNILNNVAFIYGLPNDKALPVLKFSGFKIVGKLTRYVYIVRYSTFLPNLIKLPFVPFLAGFIIDIVRGSFSHFINIIKINGVSIQEVDCFNAELDLLIKNSEFSAYLTNSRQSTYINWRYLNNPQHSYEGVLLKSENSQIPIAYYIFEKINDSFHVIEYFSLNKASLLMLISAVKEQALIINCSTISISFMGSKEISDIFLNSGFHMRESERNVVVKSKDESIMRYLMDEDNWYFVDGDEDQ